MFGLTVFADIVNASLTVLLGYLMYSFFGKSRRSPLLRLSFLVVGSVFFSLSLRFFPTGILRFCILFALTFSVTFLFELKTLYRIVYSAIYITLCVLSEGITAIYVSKILNVELIHSTEGFFYVLGTLISKLIVLIVIMLISVKKHKSLIGIPFKHTFFLQMIPLSTLVILVLQYNYDYIVTIPTKWAWVLSGAYLLLMLSNIAVFDYMDSLYQNAVDKGKLLASEQIVKEQEKQYTAIQKHYNDIAAFRHNQKNISIGILNEIKEGQIESAAAHLQESISLLSAQNIRSAGIIHSIVDIKAEEAKAEGIDFRYEYQSLQKVSISDIDIAVLLGNALDNAIEANLDIEEGERFIELLITVRNSNLIIYIKNPVKDTVNVQHLISKKSGSAHGFGVVSMRQIVERFNGDIVFACRSGVFEVNIVLPNIVMDTTINE